MPSTETSVALVVCHVSDADCPAWILVGLTAIEAVGAGGGGGGGGGGGAAFFLHAPSARRALSAITVNNHFVLLCFTFILLRPQSVASGQTKRIYYFQLQFGCVL